MGRDSVRDADAPHRTRHDRRSATPIGRSLAGALLVLLLVATPAAGVPAADAGPDAAIDVRPGAVAPNETVTLDASGSEAPWALPTLYAWDLDDDGFWEHNGGCCHLGSLSYREIDASFAEPGVHAVRLHFTDHLGQTDTARAHVAVTLDGDDRPPNASFYVTDPDPRVDEDVTLHATSTDPDGVVQAHRWDTDDDGEYDDGTGQNVTVAFEESQDVTVMAVDDGGRYDTATRTVEPLEGEDRTTDEEGNRYAPTARIDVHDGGDGVQVGETVTLDCRNSSDMAGFVVLQQWDVDDDGTYEYDRGPIANDGTFENRRVDVAFDEPGVHPVTLWVMDDDGAVDRAKRAIHVEERGSDVQAPGIRQHPDGAERTAVQLIADVPPEISVEEYEWDTDGDGVTDAMGPTAVASPDATVRVKFETASGGIATNSTTVDGG
jgi:hypothetical protein